MAALKKPIKIKVIDEDEIKNPSKKDLKNSGVANKEDLELVKKAITKKKGAIKKVVPKKNVKKKGAKKIAAKVVKAKAVKKSVPQKSKKVLKVKEELPVKNIIEEIDEVAVAVNKVSAVKNIVMSSGDEKEIEDKDENKEELNVEENIKEDIEEENVIEDPYDVKNDSVKDIIDSSINEEQIKQEKKIDNNNDVYSKRSIAMYRKIAISFIVFTVALVAVISYFSFVRVTIVLIPNQERINNSVIFDVHDNEIDAIVNNNLVNGIVEKVQTKVVEEFKTTGETILGQEAVGEVVIYNNHNKNQPLVATTRLLPVSDPNKLFRISNTVNVPAGSSIKVDIYADDPGPDMAIGATKFTIPGLWAGLQDKIYAESDEKIAYRQKVEKYVLQDDIDNSERYLKQKLISNVKLEIDSSYAEYGKVIYKIDENSIDSSTDAEVNDDVDVFDIEMSASVVVVAFDSEGASNLAEQKFISALSENKELLSFDKDNIIYSLNNYNVSDKTATVNATFEGRVSLKDDSGIIDKEKIVGLNKQQLDAYLKELPDIAGYEVKFYPPFINKIPKLIELSKIKIEIKK
jgi:hypothetical protein